MGDASAMRFYDDHPGHASLREEVLRGLALKPIGVYFLSVF